MRVKRVKAGDIMFTRGQSWISRAIRWASRSPGEGRTRCNHVGLVVLGSTHIRNAIVVEALQRVMRHPVFYKYLDGRTELLFMRPQNLSSKDLEAVIATANSHVGKKYGYGKIALHGLDTLLTRLRGQDVYLFRRMGKMENYPICSWLVDDAFRDGVGKDFGVPQRQCQPDDILDFCEQSPHYRQVWGWSRLP